MRYEPLAEKYLKMGRRGTGPNVMCLCLWHDDTSPSMSFNMETGAWICFSCGEKGGIPKLARRLGLIVKPNGFVPELDDPLADLLELMDELEEAPDPGQDVSPSILPESYRLAWQNDEATSMWDALRRVDAATVERFGLGYNPNEDALTMPVRDNDGHLLGISLRNLSPNKHPKYKTPFGYTKAEFLYGYWPQTIRTIDASKTPHHIVLVEGQIDAIMVWQAGYNVGAVMGTGLTRQQRKLLYRSGVMNVTLFFDDDRPGFHMAMQALGLLRRDMTVYAASYQNLKEADPGAMNTTQIRSCIDSRIMLDD